METEVNNALRFDVNDQVLFVHEGIQPEFVDRNLLEILKKCQWARDYVNQYNTVQRKQKFPWGAGIIKSVQYDDTILQRTYTVQWNDGAEGTYAEIFLKLLNLPS